MNAKPNRTFKEIFVFFILALAFFAFPPQKNLGFSQPENRTPLEAGSTRSAFSEALLTQETLAKVKQNYYDRSRIDPHKLLKNGLMALSRAIPEILVEFPDASKKIIVTVGRHQQSFDLPAFKNELEPLIPILKSIYAFIEKHYDGDIELPEIERNVLNGMLESLDPHSMIFSPKAYKAFMDQTRGEFGGLGIIIGLREGDLTIMSVLPNTPAARAALKSKDKILRINTEATINMGLNDAVEKLRGIIGTTVTLQIGREGTPQAFEVELTRAKITIESIQSELMESENGDVGFIKIKGFQEYTHRDLVQHLKQLQEKSKNFKGLILDMRSNPGGLLTEAIQIADLFLESGVIVSTTEAGGIIRNRQIARSWGTEDRYPIVVLVNESSASASEIVAGALKNNQRAIVLGQQTFGKGSVQNIEPLKDGSAMKMTIHEYLTPGDVSIQSIGITPDVELVAASIAAEKARFSAPEMFSEKDLDEHLDSHGKKTEKPQFTIHYLDPKEAKDPESQEDPEDYSNDLKLDQDHPAQIAKRMILKTTNPIRPEFLKEIQELEKTIEKEEDEKIAAALKPLGIDWTLGANRTGEPKAEISFSILDHAPGEAIKAGEEVRLSLTVKNVGSGDFYQLKAKTESENPIFKNREFILGHIPNGQTKTWTTKVKVQESALLREDELKFVFEEAHNKNPDPFKTLIKIDAKPVPNFSYSYQIEGKAEKGASIDLVLTIENKGPGVAKEATVNLKNLEGQGILITEGRVKLGHLEPQGKAEAKLKLKIQPDYPKNSAKLELSITDPDLQEGLSEKIKLDFMQAKHEPRPGLTQELPEIQIKDLRKNLSTQSKLFNVQGKVRSSSALKDVLIFVGEKKVFLKTASEPAQNLDFSFSVPLEDKNNLITVFARDQFNLTRRESFYVRKIPGPESESAPESKSRGE